MLPRFLLPLLLLLSAPLLRAQRADFTLGADISWETEMEAKGYTFANAAGQARECTALMQELGLNAVRLRVWVDPTDGFCNRADVVEKALRAQRLGMDIMIDFHYSDWWADPGKQNIPAAWATHSYDEMTADVSRHTTDVLTALREAGVDVRWVQVGNETSNGLLWPTGQADKNPAQYAGLVDAGYAAVKAVYPEALVVVHLDNGFDNGLYSWNLGLLRQYGARFDMVGMSLYPYSAVEWNGLASTQLAVSRTMENIRWVYETYGLPSMIVETGMKVARPAEGKELLAALLRAAREQTDGHCRGVMYWEPEAPAGYNGGYDMGAFAADARKVCTPTAIMQAFTDEAAAVKAPICTNVADMCKEIVISAKTFVCLNNKLYFCTSKNYR